MLKILTGGRYGCYIVLHHVKHTSNIKLDIQIKNDTMNITWLSVT